MGSLWLVGNAPAADDSLVALARELSNVRIADDAHGAGVYEAVMTTLAERR